MLFAKAYFITYGSEAMKELSVSPYEKRRGGGRGGGCAKYFHISYFPCRYIYFPYVDLDQSALIDTLTRVCAYFIIQGHKVPIIP